MTHSLEQDEFPRGSTQSFLLTIEDFFLAIVALCLYILTYNVAKPVTIQIIFCCS